MSELEGLHPIYQSSVTFSTLKTADTGSYTCSANVSPVNLSGTESSENSEAPGDVIESQWASSTLGITVSK